MSDAEVKQKCQVLFRQWATSYKSTPGLERIATLYKQLPQKKKPVRQDQSKVLKETEAEAEPEQGFGYSVAVSSRGAPLQSLRSPTSPTSSTPKLKPATLSPGPSLLSPSKQKYDKNGKKVKSKPFNLEKEKPSLLQAIASSSVASTNLMNALKLINRENKRVSEDAEAVKRFETCKLLRRQILRYIQYVESEQWLGSLIHANEELINSLMAFEVLDKSVDDDSDSEEEEDGPSSKVQINNTQTTFAGLSLGGGARSPTMPARPNHIPMPSANDEGREDTEEEGDDVDGVEDEDDDEDDPFADRNAVGTPHVEKSGMTW